MTYLCAYTLINVANGGTFVQAQVFDNQFTDTVIFYTF